MKRSVIARDLRTPKYRPRIVKSKKVYSRKPRRALLRKERPEHLSI